MLGSNWNCNAPLTVPNGYTVPMKVLTVGSEVGLEVTEPEGVTQSTARAVEDSKTKAMAIRRIMETSLCSSPSRHPWQPLMLRIIIIPVPEGNSLIFGFFRDGFSQNV